MGFPAFRTPRYARRGGVLLAAALASLAMAWASPAAAEANSTVDGDLFNLINQDRANAGVAPLRWSSTLGGIAESAPYGGCGYTISGRAQDLLQRNYFSHTILNCGSQTVFNMMQANGIAPNPAGENISFGRGLAQRAHISDKDPKATYADHHGWLRADPCASLRRSSRRRKADCWPSR